MLSRRVPGAKRRRGWAVVVEQTHIVFGSLLMKRHLDAISRKAENGTNPQENGEATKHLSTEFDPFWSGGGWRECIGSISIQDFLCLFGAKALCEEGIRRGRKSWKKIKEKQL